MYLYMNLQMRFRKRKFGPILYFISICQVNIKFHQSPYTLAPFHNGGYKKWTALFVRHAYKNHVNGQDKNTNFSWTNVYKLKHAQRQLNLFYNSTPVHGYSILLHSGLNPAWHFWLSTRFSCLKMKSVENILGYIREQF